MYGDGGHLSSSDALKLVHLSHKYTQVASDEFLHLLSTRGWIFSPSLLGADEWRCSWSRAGVKVD